MVLSLYLSRVSSDFNEIWYSDANFGSKNCQVTKCWNFANSKWRTTAILKKVYGYIKTIYCPIDAKITFRYRSRDTKPNFENSRWRTAAILKMVLSQYLSREKSEFNVIRCADADIDFKNGHVIKYRNFANSKWWTAAILKIVFWLYLND